MTTREAIDDFLAQRRLAVVPDQTEEAVRGCAQAGIRRVWMHRGAGRGAVSESAVELCRGKGIEVVAGYCPYMFLPQGVWFHRLHGWLMRMRGTYPS
jgi:predicted CoA-binding protein